MNAKSRTFSLGFLAISTLISFGNFGRAQESAAVPRNLGLSAQKEDDGATRRALVVGVRVYENKDFNLVYPDKDAAAVTRVLREAGWIVVTMAMSEDLMPITAESIRKELAALASESGPNDTLLFYFSGHGYIDGEQQFRLCPYDVNTSSDAPREKRGLSLDVVRSTLAGGDARRVLIVLDCCRTRAKAPNDPGPTEIELCEAEGIGVLYGTAPGSYSWEPSGLESDENGITIDNGRFTHYFLRALTGEARLHDDGYLTFLELSKWVARKMNEASAKLPPHQRQSPFTNWDGKAEADVILRPIAKLEVARTDSANAAGQTDQPKMRPPKLVSCSPTGSTELNAGSVVDVQLQFDAQVNSVSVGGVALQIDATKRSATGTISVPTGAETCNVPWVAVAVNGSRADGELTWRVKSVVVTPFEVLSRNPNWTGTAVVRGQSRSMTVAFVVTSNGIKASDVNIDGASRYFTMVGDFSGRKLEFDMRGNSKDIVAVFGVNVKVAAPAELSSDGRSITGKFSDKKSGVEIGSFTLHPN